MLKICLKSIFVSILFCGISSVFGQKATEIYIPIGKSPGLSGKKTMIGKIVGADYREHSLMIQDPSGTYTIKITEATSIWLDRSSIKKPNQIGSMEDCQEGRTVEAKYQTDPHENKKAEWIKIQITGG